MARTNIRPELNYSASMADKISQQISLTIARAIRKLKRHVVDRYQPLVAGKGLSTNDLTAELKSNYDASYAHSQNTHAPSNAQKNSDITKEEIEAKLTGEISSHTHANGGGGLTQSQVLSRTLGG